MKNIVFIILILSSISPLIAAPIHYFSKTNNVEGIRKLVRFKDQVDYYGYKPIHYAAKFGQFNALRELLNHNVDINATTLCEGATALHFAAAKGNKLMIDYLLQNGANINAHDRITLATPIHYSIYHNNFDAFEVLHTHKDFDFKKHIDKFGRNVLHWAIIYYRVPMVEIILKSKKAESIKNAIDFSGYSPLKFALELQQTNQCYCQNDISFYENSIAIQNIINFLTANDNVDLTTPEVLPVQQIEETKKYSEYDYLSQEQNLPLEDQEELEIDEQQRFLTYDEIETQLPDIDSSINKYNFKSNDVEPRTPKTNFVSQFSQTNGYIFKSDVAHPKETKKNLVLKEQTLSEPIQTNFDEHKEEDITEPIFLLSLVNDEVKQSKKRLSRAEKKQLDKLKKLTFQDNPIQHVNDPLEFKDEIKSVISDISDESSASSTNTHTPHIQVLETKEAEIKEKKPKNKTNNSGNTELHIAIISKLQNIKHLINEKTVKIPNAEGNYPLHYAIIHKSPYCRNILEAGADVNAQNLKLSTALAYAVNSRNISLIDLLLEFNADISYLDDALTKLLIDLANKKENQEYAHLNKFATTVYSNGDSAASAQKPVKTLSDYEKFLKAVIKGKHLDVREMYNKNKNLAYQSDNLGKLPIHYAASKKADITKCLPVLMFLAAKEPATFITADKEGKTAMQLLFDSETNYEACKFIIKEIMTKPWLVNLKPCLPIMEQYCKKCLELAEKTQNYNLIDTYKELLKLF